MKRRKITEKGALIFKIYLILCIPAILIGIVVVAMATVGLDNLTGALCVLPVFSIGIPAFLWVFGFFVDTDGHLRPFYSFKYPVKVSSFDEVYKIVEEAVTPKGYKLIGIKEHDGYKMYFFAPTFQIRRAAICESVVLIDAKEDCPHPAVVTNAYNKLISRRYKKSMFRMLSTVRYFYVHAILCTDKMDSKAMCFQAYGCYQDKYRWLFTTISSDEKMLYIKSTGDHKMPEYRKKIHKDLFQILHKLGDFDCTPEQIKLTGYLDHLLDEKERNKK